MRLKEFIENLLESVSEIESYYEKNKHREENFEKKILEFNYEKAENRREIVTFINGKKETKNIAQKGDYIMTGTKDEIFSLSPEKFKSRYSIKSGKAVSKPVKISAIKFDGPDTTFVATWGEETVIEKDDYLVKEEGGFYRIEKEAFQNTYRKIN